MASTHRITLRSAHFSSAIIIGVFIALHMANHIIGLAGQRAHSDFMQTVRPFYRNAMVEPLLLALLAFQAISGITLVVRGWRSRTGTVAWIQAVSGLYLAVFLLLHTLAVFSGRYVMALDTDFRFAAAGFHVGNWPWYFWPYYTLAITFLFTHLGCAIYWSQQDLRPVWAKRALQTLVLAGTALGLLVSSALAGKLYPVDIPPEYKAGFASG